MSEETTVSEDAEEVIADAPSEKTKPGLVRWKGVIILPVIMLILVGVIWLFGDGWLASTIRGGMAASGYSFGDETSIEADLFGGSIGFTKLAVDRDKETTRERLVTAPTAAIDLAVIDTLTSGDVILDRIHVGDASVVLEEFAKPPQQADASATTDDAADTTELPDPDNIREWWETAKTWRQRLQDWFGDDEQATTDTDGVSEKPVTVDITDPRVSYHHPIPSGDGQPPATDADPRFQGR